MPEKVINFIFRKPAPQFNSIENVFNAIIPYIQNEFEVRKIYIPFRTSGPLSMQKNLHFLRGRETRGIVHITGHENYLVNAVNGKSILTLHDIGSTGPGRSLRDRFIRKNWFKDPIQRADRVTVISHFSLSEITSGFSVQAGKISVIPNPVDDRILFSPGKFNSEKPTILFTKANKNLERTIEALSGVVCSLIILGELTSDQSRLLSHAGIDFVNKFNLPYDEVAQLYKISDLLLFPSLYEGFGLPILEAQATGRVVITSNRGVMPSTAGKGAFFVDPDDPASIREAIIRVKDDSNLRDSLITSGLENVKKYRASLIAEQYLHLYHNLLNET